jgi:hypothetical protein
MHCLWLTSQCSASRSAAAPAEPERIFKMAEIEL